MKYLRPGAWLLASVACLAGFFELAEDFAYSPKIHAFDHAVTSAIISLRSAWLNPVMTFVTVLGGTIVVSAASAAVVAIASLRGRPRAAVYTLAVLVAGVAFSALGKSIFDRPRPPVSGALIALPTSYSFPSGHTMGSLCLAWVVCYLVLTATSASRSTRSAVTVAAVVYALVVAFSRVYLGVHYPSDVLASWLLGAGWIALVTTVYELVTGRKLAEAG
ncbi:MAG TPA: phosphatase PAP2 family protein [Coriobacteriia bacterium]|nr:phosphatase PAP2 family protein [Coriobacteriia bacterium]